MRDAVSMPLEDAPRERGLSSFVIFAVSFAVLFAVAVGSASLGLKWRDWLPGAEGGDSLIGAVRSAVCSFMSYLP